MEKENRGRPKDQWRPPAGYKSALAKARDAARAAEKAAADKSKNPSKPTRKMAPLTPDGEDTASDSDWSDIENVSGQVQAITRFRTVTNGAPMSKAIQSPSGTNTLRVNAMNRVSSLESAQIYDNDALAALNQWAHDVKSAKDSSSKNKNSKVSDNSKLDRTVNYIASSKKPDAIPDVVVVYCGKDVNTLSKVMASEPTDKKSLTKISRKLEHIEVQPDEKLCMADSGSTCHAINAEVESPDHYVEPLADVDQGRDAESACGGVIKRKGKVKTRGTVEGKALNIKWNAMDVEIPILSVRRLVHDGHNVDFRRYGGYVKNLRTGERIPFF